MFSLKKAALSAVALTLLAAGAANAVDYCKPKKVKRVRCPQPVACDPCALAYRQEAARTLCPPANPCPPVNPCQAAPAQAPAVQYVYVQVPVQTPAQAPIQAPAVQYIQAPVQAPAVQYIQAAPAQAPAVRYIQAPAQAPVQASTVQYAQTAAPVQQPVIVAHPPETMPRSMMPVRFVIGTEHMPVPTLENPARPFESGVRYVPGPEFPAYPPVSAAPAVAAVTPAITASPVVALPPSAAAEPCAPCGSK